jgi:hypothetical protein
MTWGKGVSQVKEFVKPMLIEEDTYQTASAEHCHQVKVNDCSFPAKG